MSASEHRRAAPVRARFGVLTVSDTRTPQTDEGGALAVSLIESAGHAVTWRSLCADEPDLVRAAVEAATARADVDAILTTGGTGLSRRDRTFEAVSALHEVSVPGFGELFRHLSYEEIGTAAMLSRATAGVVDGRPVFSVPGAPAAVRLALERIILPEIGHLLGQLARGAGEGPMKIRVKLFASFAQIAGWREREIEVKDGAVAKDVLVQLGKGPLIALPPGTRPLIAVNRRHVPPGEPLSEGDEVAVFPPVSGGSRAPSGGGPAGEPVFITADPLDAAALTASVRAPQHGAVVTFEGVVRDENEGQGVTAIRYEAYEEMALSLLRSIRAETLARWPQAQLALAHRTGRLLVGDTSVVVACASPHRRDAFAACAFAMDRIKEALPVWKSEERTSGPPIWLS